MINWTSNRIGGASSSSESSSAEMVKRSVGNFSAKVTTGSHPRTIRSNWKSNVQAQNTFVLSKSAGKRNTTSRLFASTLLATLGMPKMAGLDSQPVLRQHSIYSNMAKLHLNGQKSATQAPKFR